MNTPPLIVSAWLEEKAFDFVNALRKQHFPADRNVIDAHLTLFHALPNTPGIITTIKEHCNNQPPVNAVVVQPVSIGKGVALKVDSPGLVHLHTALRQAFKELLTPQDGQKLWPHITIQNKVTVEEARKLLTILSADFQSFPLGIKGLQVWEYLGGPWKLLYEFHFNQTHSSQPA